MKIIIRGALIASFPLYLIASLAAVAGSAFGALADCLVFDFKRARMEIAYGRYNAGTYYSKWLSNWNNAGSKQTIYVPAPPPVVAPAPAAPVPAAPTPAPAQAAPVGIATQAETASAPSA